MNKTLVTLLSVSFLLVGMPLVSADETHPDCEEGQWFVSYSENGQTLASKSPVFVCEGEHWDGQDPISSADSPGMGPGNTCTDTTSAPETIYFCQDADPNCYSQPCDTANALAGVPVSARVSQNGEAAYVALHISTVGWAVVYADGDMAAVYLRDDAPLNVLATVVSSAGLTRGYVSEADCTQEKYQAAAIEGNRDPSDPDACGRDNTAVTVVYGSVLP